MTHQTIRSLPALSDTLAARRQQLGLTQCQLDQLAGLRPGTTRHFERRMSGLRNLDLDAILRALRLRLALRLRPGHAGKAAA